MEKAPIKEVCSKEATQRYIKERKFLESFYKDLHNGIKISTIGIGTYKGSISELAEKEWENAIIKAVLNGFNVLDTASRYRRQKSEQTIGKCINILKNRYNINRESIFISTKGGLIGTPKNKDINININEYLKDYLNIEDTDIYKNQFCVKILINGVLMV